MRAKQKALLYSSMIIVSWILILAVSPLRDMFLAQTFRGGDVLPSVIPRGKPDFAQLAKEHPSDLSIQLSKVDQEQSLSGFDSLQKSQKKMQEDDDVIIKNFPQAVLPIAYALGEAASWMKPIRSTEPYYDYEVAKRKIKDSQLTENKTRNYSQTQWRHVISLCKRGQQLAPRNAYFDLIEAYWQFAEFHDDAAWKAIERALKKPDFNNYVMASRQSKLQAYRIAYGRPLTWEEISVDVGNLIGEFNGNMTAFYQLSFWTRWAGTKAQIDGNHQLALKRYSQAFQVMSLQYRNDTGSLDNDLASVGVYLSLEGPQHAGTKPDKTLPQETGKLAVLNQQEDQTYSAFKNYVVAHHRPDMEQFIAIAKAAMHQNRALMAETTQAQKPYLASFFTGILLWIIGVLLLWLLTGGLAVWLVSMFCKKVLLRKSAATPSQLSAKDYWQGAFSFAALPASLGLLVCYTLYYWQRIDRMKPSFYEEMINVWLPIEDHFSPWWIVGFGVFTAILFGIGFALRRAALRHQKSDAPKVLLWKRVLGGGGSILFVILWATVASGVLPFSVDLNSIYQKVFGMIFGVDEFSSAPSPSNPLASLVDSLMRSEYFRRAILVAAVVFVIVGLAIYLSITIRQWLRIEDKRVALHDLWNLLNGSALRFLMIASVLYLLTLAIAIPIRAPLHKRTLIKAMQGEMAIVHNNPTNALSKAP